MSSSNYKSSKGQTDKVYVLEQKIQLLTQQLEEQQHINENYEIYKEQLYSQMEKYIEIIDYTMKLLYKLNEFMKSKSDEAINYSTVQIDKVTLEEKQIIQKLNGLYSLSEPCLENLKGVEEYQIVGEDTQATIISKIQGVAKIVVDNIKTLGQNCVQHEKLKYYTAEKIVSINVQQEKMEQEHKYMTLQLQKEIQQTASQLKDQSLQAQVQAQVCANIQQQQPSNEGQKNADMWVDIVSKLVEYCTTLQINQMQIQNQLNSAVQKLFKSKREYQIISSSNNKLKRDQYIKDDILSEHYSESKLQNEEEDDDIQQERVPAGRSPNIIRHEISSDQFKIENSVLKQLESIKKQSQMKDQQFLPSAQQISVDKTKQEIHPDNLSQQSNKLQIQNQLKEAVQNLFKNKMDFQMNIKNNLNDQNPSIISTSNNENPIQSVQANISTLEQIQIKQEEEDEVIVEQDKRYSTNPLLNMTGKIKDSQFESNTQQNQQQQEQFSDLQLKSSQKKHQLIIPSSQQLKNYQSYEQSKFSTLKEGTSNQKNTEQSQKYEQKLMQDDPKPQIVEIKKVQEFQVQERVPAGRGLKNSIEQQSMASKEDFESIKPKEHLLSVQTIKSSNQKDILNVQSIKTQQSSEQKIYSTLQNEQNNQRTQNQSEQLPENSSIAKFDEPKSQIRQIKLSSTKKDIKSSQKKDEEEFQYQYQTNKSYATEKNQEQSSQQHFSKRSLGFPEAINKISISDQILLDVQNQSNCQQLNNSYISPNFTMFDKSKLQTSATDKPALGFQSISQFNKSASQNNNSNLFINQMGENNISNINNSMNTNNNLVSDSSRQQVQTTDFNNDDEIKQSEQWNFFGEKFNFDDKVIGNPPQLSSLHNKLERITTMQLPQRNSNSSNSQQDYQSIYSSRQQEFPQQMRSSKPRERIFSTNTSQASQRRSIATNRSLSNFGEFAQMNNNNGLPSNTNMSYIDQRKVNNNTNLCVNSSQEWQFSVQQQQNTLQNNHQHSLSRISKTDISWNSFENLQIPLRQSLQQQQQQPSLRNLMNVVNQQRINSSRSISNTNRQTNTSAVEQPSQLYQDLLKQQQQIMYQSNSQNQNPLDQSSLNRSRLSQGQRRKIFETNDSHRSQDGSRQQSNENTRRQLSQYQTANLGVTNNERSFYSSNNNTDSSRVNSNYQSNAINSKPPQYTISNKGGPASIGGQSQRTDRNPGQFDQGIRETFKVQLDTNYNSFQNKENFTQIIPKNNDKVFSQSIGNNYNYNNNNNKSNHNSSQERMSQNSLKSKEPLSENSQNVSMMSNKSQKQFYSISELSKMSQQNRDKKRLPNQLNM